MESRLVLKVYGLTDKHEPPETEQDGTQKNSSREAQKIQLKNAPKPL